MIHKKSIVKITSSLNVGIASSLKKGSAVR